jgi:hypothetical protein
MNKTLDKSPPLNINLQPYTTLPSPIPPISDLGIVYATLGEIKIEYYVNIEKLGLNVN